MPRTFTRLVEIRALILHGLSESAAEHEEYMAQFREITRRVENSYDQWLLNTGRRQPRNASGDGTNATSVDTLAEKPALEAVSEL